MAKRGRVGGHGGIAHVLVAQGDEEESGLRARDQYLLIYFVFVFFGKIR